MIDLNVNPVDPAQVVPEREKWAKENEFRERDITLREAQHLLQEKELVLKEREHASSAWRSPLIVAILAGSVAALGNGGVAYYNGMQQRALEQEKSEQARILEMLKTGDPDKAAANLKFLVDGGLISNESLASGLREYLSTRSQGEGAALAGDGPVKSVIGTDDGRRIRELPSDAPIRKLAGAVGSLSLFKSGQMNSSCSAFLLEGDLLVTAGYCIDMGDEYSAKLTLMIDSAPTEYEVEIAAPVYYANSLRFTVLRVKGSPTQKHAYLRLAQRKPQRGERLQMIMFREFEQWVVLDAPDCAVLEVRPHHFRHGCDTGAGASGAPLLAKDGSVIGVHMERLTDGGKASRSDNVLKFLTPVRHGN